MDTGRGRRVVGEASEEWRTERGSNTVRLETASELNKLLIPHKQKSLNLDHFSDPGPEEDYKKKTRRNRTTFSNSQLAALEKVSLLAVHKHCPISC